jgi:Protein of unknown function (DUF3197)
MAKSPELETLDPVGLQGAPMETLAALKTALRGVKLEGAIITLIADWQNRRDTARYAVMIRAGEESIVSEDAFGGRYGVAGTAALTDLVNFLWERGAENFKESVLAPHQFARILEYPDAASLQRIVANANPTDPEIYR